MPQGPLKVALFGSYYRGLHVLDELLNGPLKAQVQVVGVATDDPGNGFISREKRVWQYPHTQEEASMVTNLARDNGISVYTGRVKTPAFYEIFENAWAPEYCIMATFGQRIDDRLFNYPDRGFYNLHPSDHSDWPSRYAGGNPFHQLMQDGAKECFMTLHHVDGGFDTGARVCVSSPITIPDDASVPDMHRLSSPVAAMLVRHHLQQLLDARKSHFHV